MSNPRKLFSIISTILFFFAPCAQGVDDAWDLFPEEGKVYLGAWILDEPAQETNRKLGMNLASFQYDMNMQGWSPNVWDLETEMQGDALIMLTVYIANFTGKYEKNKYFILCHIEMNLI